MPNWSQPQCLEVQMREYFPFALFTKSSFEMIFLPVLMARKKIQIYCILVWVHSKGEWLLFKSVEAVTTDESAA